MDFWTMSHFYPLYCAHRWLRCLTLVGSPPPLSFKVAPPPKKWQLWIWGRGTGGISWKGNYVGRGEVRWLSWCLNETSAGKYISNFQYWIYTKKAQRAKILRRGGNDDWGEVRWLSCLNENLRKVQRYKFQTFSILEQNKLGITWRKLELTL